MNAIANIAAILTGNNGATVTEPTEKERATAMEIAAVQMAETIGKAESAVAESAKTWGANFLYLVKVKGYDGDDLAEKTRAAMGWPNLTGDAGRKIKTRFNTWRSNIGKVSGKWSALDETVRNELLAGVRSFNTVYADIQKAEKEEERAAKAAKAAADKAAAETETETETPATPASLLAVAIGAIETAHLALADMSDADFANKDFIDAFNALVEAYDARLNASVDTAPATGTNG